MLTLTRRYLSYLAQCTCFSKIQYLSGYAGGRGDDGYLLDANIAQYAGHDYYTTSGNRGRQLTRDDNPVPSSERPAVTRFTFGFQNARPSSRNINNSVVDVTTDDNNNKSTDFRLYKSTASVVFFLL
jgi:hypothetical protein